MAQPHQSDDTSSGGNGLPVLNKLLVVPSDHESNCCKQFTNNEDHDTSETAQFTAQPTTQPTADLADLHHVLDQLASIQTRPVLDTDSDPDEKIKIAISSRGLILLHHLLELDAPFSPSRNLSPPESSAVSSLLAARPPSQIAQLRSWLSHQPFDFYDNHLVLRIPGLVHHRITNHVGNYLSQRYDNRLRAAGRSDLASKIQIGGDRLEFRFCSHEPDLCIWLDLGLENLGSHSEDDDAEEDVRAMTKHNTRDDRTTSAERLKETDRVDDPTEESEKDAEVETTREWPGLILEVGWSHSTPDEVCKRYITNGRGHIRCVLRLNAEYIRPEKESSEEPSWAVLDGWRIHETGCASSPVHFIQHLDVLNPDPTQMSVSMSFKDLHHSLSASQEVTLKLSRIGEQVMKAYRQKRAPPPKSVAEDA